MGESGVPAKRFSSTRRRHKPTCADCFFQRNLLCALALDEPCPTFRPDTPQGLVPPQQPSLLMRQGPPVEVGAETTAAEVAAETVAA